MNLDRYQVKQYLARFRLKPDTLLRHGTFDARFGIRSNYILTDVKAWLVWSGINIVDYQN